MTLENGPRHALIPIHLIDFDDHRFRFRKDFAHDNVIQLAEDIRENGQLNATKVRRKRDGRYQIIAGWRRAHAVKYLGDRPLRCDIYDGVTDEQAYRINIADNEQREDLTPLELAFQVSHLRDEAGYSVEKIADMHACKSSKIYDLLKLTQLPEELQDAVHSRSISLYLAFELGKVPVSERSEILAKTIDEGWSVRRLRRERLDLCHPFKDSQKFEDHSARAREGVWHALRFQRTPDVERLWRKHWEAISRGFGVPAPLKCEFTMSIPARENEFPYVCHNDVEWVVVSPSDIRDPLASRGWNLPLEKRDGWYFWCERCIRLTFPNCTFHHDIFFMLPLEGF